MRLNGRLGSAALVLSLAGCAGVQGAGSAANKEDPVSHDVDVFRKAVVRDAGGDAATADVRAITGATVPGITVCTAGFGRGRWYAGVVQGGAAVLDRASAMRAVVQAWGYGPRRTVPADTVALTLGTLAIPADPMVLLKADDLADVPSRYVGKAALPKETLVDGLPAVEFWARSPDPPLYRVVAVFPGGGDVKVDVVNAFDLP